MTLVRSTILRVDRSMCTDEYSGKKLILVVVLYFIVQCYVGYMPEYDGTPYSVRVNYWFRNQRVDDDDVVVCGGWWRVGCRLAVWRMIDGKRKTGNPKRSRLEQKNDPGSSKWVFCLLLQEITPCPYLELYSGFSTLLVFWILYSTTSTRITRVLRSTRSRFYYIFKNKKKYYYYYSKYKKGVRVNYS